MTHKNYLITLFLLAFLVSACRTQDLPTPTLQEQTAVPEEIETDLPDHTQTPTMIPATPTSRPLPTATTDIRNVTDNPDVNATIAALLEQNLETLLDSIMLNSQPCTTKDGLGGPPKCPAGINDGTAITFFPALGPGEGTHLTPDEVSIVFDYQEPVLFAVVLVKPPDYIDPVFPIGNYAVILETVPMGFARTFRLNHLGEIVRVDYTAWPAEQEMQDILGNIVYQK
jgi:hypothetical protein